VLPIADQPSPQRATRRAIARFAAPATQMGSRGCTGSGRNVISPNVVYGDA
jgi:hypothetical protein